MTPHTLGGASCSLTTSSKYCEVAIPDGEIRPVATGGSGSTLDAYVVSIGKQTGVLAIGGSGSAGLTVAGAAGDVQVNDGSSDLAAAPLNYDTATSEGT